MKRIYVCAVLFLLLCVFPARDARAYSVEVKRDGFLADVIPDRVHERLPDIFAELIENAKQDKDSSLLSKLVPGKDARIMFCKPYVYWDPTNEVEFYFPLARDGVILEVLQVIWKEEKKEYDYGDLEESSMVDRLNGINYLASDFVIYEYRGITYAENEKDQHLLYDISYLFTDVSDDYRKLEDDFYEKSLPQKKEAVRDKVLRFLNRGTKPYSLEVKRDGFLADVIPDRAYERLPDMFAEIIDSARIDRDNRFLSKLMPEEENRLIFCKPYVYGGPAEEYSFGEDVPVGIYDGFSIKI